jgi:alginate O-acetyltransferase complex protein AlgI
VLNLLLRTVGAILLGALVVALTRGRSLSAGSSAVFLAVQLGLILLCALAPESAVLVTVLLLGGFAFLAFRRGAAEDSSIRPVAGLYLVGFFLYWIIEKYLLPLGLDRWMEPGNGGGPEKSGTLMAFAMIGISYMGFKVIHFLLDWRAGLIKDATPLDFLGWLFFFPSIVAGPIQRFQDWQQQRAAPNLTIDAVSEGLRRVIQGMVMKFVLADNLRESTLASMSAGALSSAPPWRLGLAAAAYSLYIYWDFAGYSSMAIGIGRFWGIRLPENFDWPFVSRNLNEFWQRWHMSLSGFLRDYVYYPLSLGMKRRFGRQYPNFSAAIPPLVTFVIIGVWHGATAGFLIFGLLHGLGMAWLAVAGRYKSRTAFQRWWEGSRTGHALAVLTNFAFVTFTLAFFSVPTDNLLLLLRRLLN